MPDSTTPLDATNSDPAELESLAVDPDMSRYRDDFPILHRRVASGAALAFLDNAASTQRPDAVIDAISDCYRNFYANVHRGIHTLSEESTHRYEQARQSVATFVNAASTCEVIFAAGTTAAINTVAVAVRQGGHESSALRTQRVRQRGCDWPPRAANTEFRTAERPRTAEGRRV